LALPKKGSDLVFSVGEKIVYGYEGVFYVSDYTTSPFDKNDGRTFYVLRPVFGAENNIIVTPSEGGVTAMRAIINRDEAAALLERISDIREVVVDKERARRDIYRNVMSGCRDEDFISIIKTVRRRREEFIAQKRRLSETDTDFESRAKRCLFCELAAAMEISFAEAEKLVIEKL
jgi:RNA polymerase-interacting CarD/CdnL/TRCF family regulator